MEKKKTKEVQAYGLSQSVGFLDTRLYLCDSKNLVVFNLSMDDFRVIPLPLGLREKAQTFGMAREKLSEQVREILLI